LPVSRYRVTYQAGAGRPYSPFDRLMLEAIADGHASLDVLEATFCLHRRVIIESIVTLMQAGWVAFEKDTHRLVATSFGNGVIARPTALPKNIIVSTRADYLVSERVEAQLAKSADVVFYPRATLKPFWDQVAVLAASNIPHPLEPGLIVPLLRRFEGEWIRSCGPMDIVRDGADFVVVDVDTSTGAITGIPTKWIPLLCDKLVERARGKERQLHEGGWTTSGRALDKFVKEESAWASRAREAEGEEWPLAAGVDRFVLGSEEHLGLLEERLASARSYVAIVSDKLDAAHVRRLEPDLRAAIARGVAIDILWGCEIAETSNDVSQDALDPLKKLDYDSRHYTYEGRITVAQASAHWRPRVLISDLGDGFEVIIGSHDWLGGQQSEPAKDVSTIFHENGIVAHICRLVGDLFANDGRLAAGGGVALLRRAAGELERRIVEEAEERASRFRNPPVGASGGAGSPAGDDAAEGASGRERDIAVQEPPPIESWTVRLVIGRQHQPLLSAVAKEAQRRVVVACARWGQNSKSAFDVLNGSLERGCSRVEIQYGVDADPGVEHQDLAAGFEKLGGVIRQVPGLHPNVAAVDDNLAIVTSFAWLSAAAGRVRPGIGEIGLVFRGAGVAGALLGRLGIRMAERSASMEAEYISAFCISGVRSIRRLEWRITGDAAPGWHVLVGDNGSGKTSVLRAVAIALIGSDAAQRLRQDWATWIRGSLSEGTVEVNLRRVVVGDSRITREVGSRTVRLSWARTADTTHLAEAEREEDKYFSCGYGPLRRFTGGDVEYEHQLAAFPKLARHLSLFDERVALTESLVWLQELRFKSLEDDREAGLLLNQVLRMVNDWGLLPFGVKLAKITSIGVFFRDDLGNEFNIAELSDGYRSILSLTFDIVRQLASAFGAARVFDEHNAKVALPGIVLIDEVDAHLHPSWKRTLGQWFRSHFPLVQFIVTTHSFLVCQAAEHGTVFKLPSPDDKFDEGRMLEGVARSRLIYGNALDAFASGAFGDGPLRSETSERHLQRLAELNRREVDAGLSQEEKSEQAILRAELPSTPYVE
jgi:hypothetical protein